MGPKPIQICIRIFIITLSIFRNIIGILFYKVKSHDSRVKFDFKKTLAEWCLISFSFLLHHVGICIWSCYTKGDTSSWNLEKLGTHFCRATAHIKKVNENKYRVSHSEMNYSEWLWGVEWLRTMVTSGFKSSGHLSFIRQFSKK